MARYRVGRRGVTNTTTEIDADRYVTESGMVTFIREDGPVASLPVDNVAYVAALTADGDLPFEMGS